MQQCATLAEICKILSTQQLHKGYLTASFSIPICSFFLRIPRLSHCQHHVQGKYIFSLTYILAPNEYRLLTLFSILSLVCQLAPGLSVSPRSLSSS